MSSRSLLIVGIVGGILAGVALFVVALAVVAIDGAVLSGQMMALLMLGSALGFVLDATWLTLGVGQLSKLDRGREDEQGGDGWGKPGPDPARPWPPSEDSDWWTAFERDFRAYHDARARAIVD